MAKITIVIEDRKDGMVKIVCHPKLEQIIAEKMKGGKKDFTPAEAYTFKAMQACHEASKRLDKFQGKAIVKPGEIFG